MKKEMGKVERKWEMGGFGGDIGWSNALAEGGKH